jgi:hypothetical protein
VQNALDTFYVMLRDRVAAGNAMRTMVVRGTLRPAVLVVENELVAASADGLQVVDGFCLRWKELRVDRSGPLPMVTAVCEIRYGTDGTVAAGGMDRGRLLAGMDAELAAALGASPRSVAKTSFVSGAAVTMGTSVSWGDPVFGAAVAKGERMERTAVVEVYSYQEAGEV